MVANVRSSLSVFREKWRSFVRFLELLLASSYEFGVILQDDARVGVDFVRRVEAAVTSLSPAQQTVGYRLSLWDFGLLIPRRAVPRFLYAACADAIDWPTDVFSFTRIGCCPLFYDALPWNELVTQAADFVSTLGHPQQRPKKRLPTMYSVNDFLVDPNVRVSLAHSLSLDDGVGTEILPLCRADYPGKPTLMRQIAVAF